MSLETGMLKFVKQFLHIVVLTLAFCGMALAQAPVESDDRATSAKDARDRLLEIQSSITLSLERAEALRQEIAQLDGNRPQQNAALVAAAQRVGLAEIEVDAIGERLAIILESEERVRKRLDGENYKTSNLLAALQRLSQSPPPALIVEPADAVGSARSAILLASILPQLRIKAQSVGMDLKQLVEIRKAAEDEEELFRANLTTLHEEQLRIATLIEARNQGVSRAREQLSSEEQAAEILAERATSLGELIRELSDNIDSVSTASDAAFADSTNTRFERLDEETIQLAFANLERDAPAVPFTSAHGYLNTPAAGVLTNKFGDDDGFGGKTKGISLVTRADAQIVAPADGWIMYKGPYLNYGQIIILNPGQGYTILLAGLEHTNVSLGQFVMMGEPIGTMGSRTIGQAVATNAGVSRPTLYIELRNHDTPLDPSSWWVERDNKTQSG